MKKVCKCLAAAGIQCPALHIHALAIEHTFLCRFTTVLTIPVEQ